MGNAFSDSASYCARVSTLYSPKLTGQTDNESYSKLQVIKPPHKKTKKKLVFVKHLSMYGKHLPTLLP